MADIFELFKKISKEEKKETSAPVSWIIAGLGNPGRDYEITRHNAGFLCMDVLSDRCGVRVDRAKFHALCGEATISGQRVLLMKPMTMMNSSGEAIREAAAFYKIPPEHILVLVDDIYLPVGHLRVRSKVSAGGHNGLKSINKWLGTEKYPRVKIGVGKKPTPEYDLADWVLGNLPDGDMKLTESRLDDIFDAVRLIISGDIEKAMNLYNRTER